MNCLKLSASFFMCVTKTTAQHARVCASGGGSRCYIPSTSLPFFPSRARAEPSALQPFSEAWLLPLGLPPRLRGRCHSCEYRRRCALVRPSAVETSDVRRPKWLGLWLSVRSGRDRSNSPSVSPQCCGDRSVRVPPLGHTMSAREAADVGLNRIIHLESEVLH
jgi:hypothetical protein